MIYWTNYLHSGDKSHCYHMNLSFYPHQKLNACACQYRYMQRSPIGFFNPVTPSDPNFPVHTAHPVPWILSIPNLALILLSNPESRRSNEEKPASREICWGPYAVAFCHGRHVDRKIYLLENLLYMIYIYLVFCSFNLPRLE